MVTKLPKDKALYVEGGFRVWLREAQVFELIQGTLVVLEVYQQLGHNY
jgi:hypothetical protein